MRFLLSKPWCAHYFALILFFGESHRDITHVLSLPFLLRVLATNWVRAKEKETGTKWMECRFPLTLSTTIYFIIEISQTACAAIIAISYSYRWRENAKQLRLFSLIVITINSCWTVNFVDKKLKWRRVQCGSIRSRRTCYNLFLIWT